jgi:hypothetical protein
MSPTGDAKVPNRGAATVGPMCQRRGGSLLALTLGVGVVVMATLGASAPSTTAPANYRDALIARLAKEYGDPSLAASVVNGLNDDLVAKLQAKVPRAEVASSPFLAYRPPRVAAGRVDSVLVFAFGNRLAPDGSLVPGPTNDALAKVTRGFVAKHHVPVYAQTEIAHTLIAEGVKDVVSIDPVIGADGKIVYLSTAGVAAQTVSKAAAAGRKLGAVGVIGFADHAVRCVLTARAAGMTAAVPRGVVLPATYDPQSNQSWTRNRAAYLPTDLLGRIATL